MDRDSTAILADIRRLTLQDGPGTRDTVFLKGCPLHCLWCHNPESISPAPQMLFREHLCLSCGECGHVCPAHAHRFTSEGHRFERTLCRNCGACAEACLPGALTLCGKAGTTPEQVFHEVIRDRDFFAHSGGGVTVSGGEPLLYPGFVRELFRMLRQEGIPTALDTCGEAPFDAFQEVLPFTNLILYDIKGMDEERHRQNTGRSNARILENLARLGKGPIPMEIRMPIVPGYNDAREDIRKAGEFLAPLPAVSAIRLLAYHSLARNKYRFCGRTDTMPQVPPPSQDSLAQLAAILAETSGKTILLPET